jgi:hypothetical protein
MHAINLCISNRLPVQFIYNKRIFVLSCAKRMLKELILVLLIADVGYGCKLNAAEFNPRKVTKLGNFFKVQTTPPLWAEDQS